MANGQPWYQYPDDTGRGQYGSYPDPMGPYAKPDDNICVPSNVPITSIVSGTVTDVSWGKSWSGSVTIKLNRPPNNFAQYAAYNFLTKIYVTPGQPVSVGTLIGYAGQNVCLAFGLTNSTPWGTGYYGATADPRLDPRPYIQNARNGKFDNGGSSGIFSNLAFTGVGNTFNSVSATAHQTLNNIPGFVGLVEALDIVEQFQPFQLPNNAGILGDIPGIGDIIKTMELPADAMQALLTFVVANTAAALFRAMIIGLGIVIFIALIMNAINQSTIDVTGQSPAQLAGSAISMGGALAALG